MNATRYFLMQTKKIYIIHLDKVMTFKELLECGYKTSCYAYSLYALLGLNEDDFLVRGEINISKDQPNYSHGWTQFKYQDKEYIFDSLQSEIIEKEKWEKRYAPKVLYKKSQKEILDEYLTDIYSFQAKIDEYSSIYQMKSLKDIEKDFPELKNFDVLREKLEDPSLEMIFNYLTLARIEIYNDEVSMAIFKL